MPSILHTKQGGTGTNAVPLENQIPIGDSNGNYQPGDISSVGFLLQTNIGVVQLPTVTKNIDGTITVSNDGIINLCETADGRGNIKQFSNIIGDTLTPIDNSISFLYADYNSGSPIYKISATNQIFLTDNTLAPVVRISRYGTRLHFEEYDEYAILTANKLVLKDAILNGARRLSGLTLSTEATRKSVVSAGQGVFSLQYYLNLEENRAGTTGYLYELYPTAGVWSENLVTEYDSSYYSDGTNRIALNNNKYVAKYFWRDIGDDNEVYYIHGQQYNTESQAFNENVPVAPFFMTGHSVYVGKIVIQKNSLNGIAYPRNWEGSIQSATVSNHNDLSGIQGGTANEYYHLTYSQSTGLTDGGISALHKHTLLSTPDGTSNFVYTDNSGTLHIDGDITQNGATFSDMTAGSILFAGTAGLLSQDNSNFFWDNTNKRLGIGTNNPSSRLHIKGTSIEQIIERSAYTEFAMLSFNTTSLQSWGIGCRTTAAAGQDTFSIYSSALSENAMTILPSGNVGIGTTEPATLLHVSGATPKIRIQDTTAFSTSEDEIGRVSFLGEINTSHALNTLASVAGGRESGTSDSKLGYLAFFTNSGGYQSEKMRITSGGNVGIGINTPDAPLTFSGTAGQKIHLYGGTSNSYVIGVEARNLKIATGIGADDRITFYTGGYEGTERMRITSAGSIVLGSQSALATNATDGFTYMPTCAGAPTGAATAYTGKVPMVIDTTNNRLYFRIGSTWRYATLT